MYSKKDVRDAIEQGQEAIYPGNKKMEKALKYITRHQPQNRFEFKPWEAVSEVTIVVLVGMALILVLGLTAILRNTQTEIARNADGSFTIKTKRPPK